MTRLSDVDLMKAIYSVEGIPSLEFASKVAHSIREAEREKGEVHEDQPIEVPITGHIKLTFGKPIAAEFHADRDPTSYADKVLEVAVKLACVRLSEMKDVPANPKQFASAWVGQAITDLTAARQRIDELEGAIRNCLDWANNHETEWGDRAMKAFEFLYSFRTDGESREL